MSQSFADKTEHQPERSPSYILHVPHVPLRGAEMESTDMAGVQEEKVKVLAQPSGLLRSLAPSDSMRVEKSTLQSNTTNIWFDGSSVISSEPLIRFDLV